MEIPLGIRDFYYDKEIGVFLICFSEMNIVSRTDTFLGNIKFPWEKGDTSHVAMGGCLVYRCQKIGDVHKFQKGFGYSFPQQTGRVDWSPEGEIFSVGLDDGQIYLFSHDKTSNYNNFNEMAKVKPHKDRVMGIYYDHDSGKCYSCSTDKLFSVTDIMDYLKEKKEKEAEAKEITDPKEAKNIKEPTAKSTVIFKSNTGFTNIMYDKPTKRFFLTNEGGEIFIFANSDPLPKQVLLMKTSKGGCLRGLWMDINKKIMFTASTTGRISHFLIGEEGKEVDTKEMKEFGLKVKSRLVVVDMERKEAFTGDEVGRITVWNIETGNVKCK